MIKLKSFLAVTVLGVQMGLICPSVFAQSENDYANYAEGVRNNTTCAFINAQSVNIRDKPNGEVVTVLNRGDGVRVYGNPSVMDDAARSGNWVRIAARVNGLGNNETFAPLEGWVFNQYINGCSEDQFDRWRR
ncbi:MAG: SH3 domain-containing protein [Pseudanabaenaceae cyanobacterium]|jgi:hypothetical protein